MTTNLDPKGLRLNVYRAAGGGTGCTNGGVTGNHDRVTLVGVQRRRSGSIKPLHPRSQVFEPTDDAPPMVLVESMLPNLYGPHLVPLELIVAKELGHATWVGPMFGGNYAGSSDGRFDDAVRLFGQGCVGLVPVHDRVETPEQYRALSQ